MVQFTVTLASVFDKMTNSAFEKLLCFLAFFCSVLSRVLHCIKPQKFVESRSLTEACRKAAAGIRNTTGTLSVAAFRFRQTVSSWESKMKSSLRSQENLAATMRLTQNCAVENSPQREQNLLQLTLSCSQERANYKIHAGAESMSASGLLLVHQSSEVVQ